MANAKKTAAATDAIQAQINDMKKRGMIFDFDNRGVSHGPECDHCGKTGIAFVDVYAFAPGEKDEHDPVSQLVFLFGTSCVKKYKF